MPPFSAEGSVMKMRAAIFFVYMERAEGVRSIVRF